MALDWLQQFYKDNHINGLDGRLDEEGRQYWLGIAADKGIEAVSYTHLRAHET